MVPARAFLISLFAVAFLAPAAGAAITTVPVATSLTVPASFTFAPDGRIFYGELRTGEIRILDPTTGSDSLFFTVPDLATTGEQGLLGIDLHPKYPSNSSVYVYATRTVAGTTRNHILRIVDSGGTGSSMKSIFSAPAGSAHNGGHIAFGPDNRLFAVVGDNGISANAQDLTNDLGKMLRMTPKGEPAGNVTPGSYIWAYGLRNSIGFGFDPETGRLWQTDNGPTCNDEVNWIRWNRNYAWGPSQTCETPPEPPVNTNQDGPDPIMPKLWYAESIAPTGLAFCSGCSLGTASEGRFFFGAWNTRELRRVKLDAKRRSPVWEAVVYTHSGRILSIETAPGGALYLSDHGGIYKLVQ